MTKPDWKQASDYEFTKALSPKGWAWEFLRRSEAYRKAYSAYLLEKKGVKTEYVFDPPMKDGETVQQWLTRCEFKEGKTARRVWLHKLRGEPFGLDGMFDPATASSEDVDFLPVVTYPRIVRTLSELEHYPSDVQLDQSDEAPEIALDPTLCIVIFDFTFSLEQQLSGLSKRLTKERDERKIGKPKAPTPEVFSWRRYIRIPGAPVRFTQPSNSLTMWASASRLFFCASTRLGTRLPRNIRIPAVRSDSENFKCDSPAAAAGHSAA